MEGSSSSAPDRRGTDSALAICAGFCFPPPCQRSSTAGPGDCRYRRNGHPWNRVTTDPTGPPILLSAVEDTSGDYLAIAALRHPGLAEVRCLEAVVPGERLTISPDVGAFVLDASPSGDATGALVSVAEGGATIGPEVVHRQPKSAGGRGSRLSSVSPLNTNLSRHSTRRRVLQAHSIGGLGPDLVDRARFASPATGLTGAREWDTGPTLTCHVGFTKSRV